MKNGTSPVSLKLLAIAIALVIASSEIINFSLMSLLWRRILEGRYFDIVFFILIWTVSLIAIYCIACSPNRLTRISWSILILCSTFIAGLSIAITQCHINVGVLALGWSSRYSSGAFFSTYWLVVLKLLITAAVLPAFLLGLPLKSRLSPKVKLSMPFIAVIFIFLFFEHTEQQGVKGLPPQFSSLAALISWTIHPIPKIERQEVNIALVEPPQIQHIVLVVDESLRADFLDINGANGVTPYLKSIEAEICNFGLSSSGNNCTTTSNVFLRMGFNPKLRAESSDNVMSHPTIWKYAHKAGFKSLFVDNQRTNQQLQNFMDPAELKLIDSFHQFDSSVVRMDRDIASIALVNRFQADNPQSFIYINKAGAHFHYETAYPKDRQKFIPHLDLYEPALDRSRMLNSYKNAVSWSVDEYLKGLLQTVNLKNTVIIYTSDHGQNLLEDGSPLTHCRLQNVTDNEVLVPLFVITKNPTLLQRFQSAAEINRNRANHFQIFPTVLSIMGYDRKAVRDTYYLELLDRVETSPGFTTAAVIEQFGRHSKWRSLNWHPVTFFGRD